MEQKDKACSIQDCVRPHGAHGWCQVHYQRWRRHGDPLSVKYVVGEGNTVEKRFWSKVAITANPDRCWYWLGKPQVNGRPTMKIHGKPHVAARLAWEFFNKQKPSLFILHSCDNGQCVNPNHLREGTQAENLQDAVIRNRLRVGENHPHAKLTHTQVVEIKLRIHNGDSNLEIAQHFPVSPAAIREIRNGANWRHVN